MIFRAPFNSYSDAELLEHFQARDTVRYFALRDEEQASPDKVAGVLNNLFDFNDECYPLPKNFDWLHNPSDDKEWLILLHKFYYAVGLGEDYRTMGDEHYLNKWLELTEHFIDTVPLEALSSDVMGRRVQNWIFAHYHFVSGFRAAIPPTFYRKFLASLHSQVNYLCNNLTPARNHRTIELYAIFLAAVVFPEFEDTATWLEFSRRELHANLKNDLLPDGVQCELSTDYHLLVVRNYLGIMRLASMNSVAMPAEMDDLLKRALEFALYVHKPDGAIPSLSDGDSRSFLAVLEQGYELYGDERLLYVATQGEAGEPPLYRSKHFPDSGYTILRSGWVGEEPFEDERYLIFDCGPLGAGNHGHLDLLSFELAAYGHSLVVDPGRYTYFEPPEDTEETNWRARFRGTAYHNTVQVDDKEQTRYVFHKTRFKIRGPEPEHELKRFITRPGFDYLHGVAKSHEYEAIHERKIYFADGDYFIVSDLLHASKRHRYDLRFHLSDKAYKRTHILVDDHSLLVEAPNLVIAQPLNSKVTSKLEPGFISRSYGIKYPAPILHFTQHGKTSFFHTVLYPYKTSRPQLSLKQVPVFQQEKPCSPTHAFALQLDVFKGGKLARTDTYFNAATPSSYRFGAFECQGSLLFIREQAGEVVSVMGDEGSSLGGVLDRAEISL